MTTTNGTGAMLHAAAADRVLVGAFVNLTAVCEQLRRGTRPVHVLCAGAKGEPALEDALLAGAFVDHVAARGNDWLNDTRPADMGDVAATRHDVLTALEAGSGAAGLRSLGYDDDIRAAAQVDHVRPGAGTAARPAARRSV